MDTQKTSARPHATGLVHVNVRHTTRYTVVGNHLAQHRELSLLAKGLALYLQSLPAGASVGIKAIAALHPESELRVAAAMRELEKHGYLARTRERLPDGRFVPRTVSYNRPGADPGTAGETPTPPKPPARARARARAQAGDTSGRPMSPPKPPPPPLAEHDRPAAALLANLRVREPRLLLGVRDVERLAPDVTVWLDRGASPDAVSRTLTACLPENLAHPAGLVAHRLAKLLPPPIPAPPPTPHRRMTLTSPRSPFAECEDCGRPFRGTPAPDGLCLDCREGEPEAA
ncbi:helix-turn-helix domain-containing protein [Streptomyces sp. NPDC050600]|uniref:helix-turn-helix domain-containing protein n=1 Tax=Streptomyces sp. NPDC050600 TaxID=3157213 RepID=UPI0034427616